MGAKSEGPEGQEGLGTRGAGGPRNQRGPAGVAHWEGFSRRGSMGRGPNGYKGLNHKLRVKDGRRETGGSGTKKAQILAPRAAPLSGRQPKITHIAFKARNFASFVGFLARFKGSLKHLHLPLDPTKTTL